MSCLFQILALLLASLSANALAVTVPQPPELTARSYLLLDMTANQILAAREIDKPLEPASLTKLMTAYLVFDALQRKKIELRQNLVVPESALTLPGSKMFLQAKAHVSVEDLIKGLIVQSGNDAAVMLAEGLAGSVEQFVYLMNEQAKALGLKSTSFQNPTGLTQAGHSTTARDLSILANRLLLDFPQYAHYFSIRKFRLDGTPEANENNRNALLFRDPTVDGLKTGHTQAAGFCLIATASRDFPNLGEVGTSPGTAQASGPRRLMAIVLGAHSENARINEAQKLLNWGYTAFEAVKLFEANTAVLSPAIWKGKANVLPLGRAQAIVVAVPAGQVANIKTQLARPEPLVAPISKGQAVGSLKIFAGEQTLSEISMTALESVEQAGILGRAWDSLRLWIR
jgi:D-alanyl-D-alanine carboxypeptidase (penicillin-binding protein 5/6)